MAAQDMAGIRGPGASTLLAVSSVENNIGIEAHVVSVASR